MINFEILELCFKAWIHFIYQKNAKLWDQDYDEFMLNFVERIATGYTVDMIWHLYFTCILFQLQARRVVVVVSVCKFPGGVFTDTPDSYFVDEHGNIEKWKFYEWKLAMLNPLRGKDILIKKMCRLWVRLQLPLFNAAA